MEIPAIEILDNNEHYVFKTEADSSLEYQLEKVISICGKLGELLDEQEASEYHYSTNKEQDYAIDSLISNYSVLIEYYYSWVIFSHIGTIHHKKLTYRSIKNIDEEIERRIEAIFRENSIGKLEKSDIDSNEFKSRCKESFKNAFSFLFIGKFHEIFVINNFLKHNRILRGYAPKAIHENTKISLPYIYISKPTDQLLNPSVLKCFFDYEINSNNRISENRDNYYVRLFNSSSKYLCKVGGLNLYEVNGVEYVHTKEFSGVLVESMLNVTYDLCSNIIEKVTLSSPGSTSTNNKLMKLKHKIINRKPKTIQSHLGC